MKIFSAVVGCLAVSLICGCDGSQPTTVNMRDNIAPVVARSFSLRQSPDAYFEQVEPPESADSLGMEFKWIPTGTFSMGEGDEAHKVTLTKPFKMGTFEVTQAQYKQVMGFNPSHFKGTDHPVENVNWNDAVEFCLKLSRLPAEKKLGNVYRLPTEAEWEYACRAGTTTNFSFGDKETALGSYAYFGENCKVKPVWYRARIRQHHPVGGKQPNGLGLHDMHGNVTEWCQDWHVDYPSGAVTDPTGPASVLRGNRNGTRVYRGGSYKSVAKDCRSACRYRGTPSYRISTTGFRVSLHPLDAVYGDFDESAAKDRVMVIQGKVSGLRKKIATAQNSLNDAIEIQTHLKREQYDYPAKYPNWWEYAVVKYGSPDNASAVAQRLCKATLDIEQLSDEIAKEKIQLERELARIQYLNSIN